MNAVEVGWKRGLPVPPCAALPRLCWPEERDGVDTVSTKFFFVLFFTEKFSKDFFILKICRSYKFTYIWIN